MNNNLIKSFIIHARKYRETSMIYDVLTEEQGLISILAKGIKSKKDGFILISPSGQKFIIGEPKKKRQTFRS